MQLSTMRWTRMGTEETKVKALSDWSQGNEPLYPMYTSLGGTKRRSGRGMEEKNPSPAANQTAATQFVANHFKNWATPGTSWTTENGK